MALAAPAVTFTATAVPTTVVLLRIVKVSVPWLTTPAGLVTVAPRRIGWAAALKVADVLIEAVVVDAWVIVTE